MGGSQLNLSMSSMNSSNKEWETMPEDLENDESHSQPLEVTLPNAYDGKYSEDLVSTNWGRDEIDAI